MLYPRIRDLREDFDKSQVNIAKLLKIGLSTYARYERGELRIPFDNAVTLSDYYKVSLDYIAGRTNDKRGLTRSELTSEETTVITYYRSLSDKRKGKLLERLEMLMEDEQNEKNFKKDVV